MYKIFISILFFFVFNSSCISQNLDSLYNLIEDNVNNQNYTEALNNTFKYKIIVQSSKKDNENNKIKIYEALAEIYKQTNKNDSAEFYYKLNIKSNLENYGENSYEHANSNFKLGMFYNEINNLNKAEVFLIKYKEVFKKSFGENSLKFDTYLNLILNYYLKSGDYEKCLPYFNTLIIHMRINLGENNINYLSSIINLATLYFKIGDFEKMGENLTNALEIAKRNNYSDSLLLSSTMTGLCLYYNTIGDYDKSIKYGLQSLEFIDNENSSESSIIPLNNIAIAYFNLSDYENSKNYYLKAISKIVLKSESDSALYANIAGNLSMLYERTKDIEKGLIYAKQSLSIFRQIDNKNGPDYARCLSNLGLLYLGNQQLDSAEKYMQSGLDIYLNENILDREKIEVAYSNLAGLYLIKKNYEKTLYYLHESNKLHNDDKNSKFLYLSENEKLKLNQSKQYFFDAYLSFVNQIYPYVPTETEVVYNNILINKEQLLRRYQGLYRKIYNSKDSNLISDFETILDNKEQLYKISAKNISNKKIDELKNNIDKLENKLNSNETIKEILLGEKSFDWKEIQKNLKLNEAAIEFVSYQYYNSKWTDSIIYAAFIIKPGIKSPLYINLFEEKELTNILVNKNRLNISHQNSIYSFKDKGAELYKIIWKKIDSSLNGVNTIFVSLSDNLYNINLTAIPINDSSKLGNKYKIHQVISTSEVVNFFENNLSKENINTAFVFGGINYDSSINKSIEIKDYFTKYSKNNNRSGNDDRWLYLNSTLTEVATINKILNANNIKNTVITGSNANESSLKVLSNDTSNYLLHIATHGYFYNDVNKKREKVKVVKSNKVFLGVKTEKDEFGIKISNIAANSPAEFAKLQINDVIYQIDSIYIKEPADLYNFLSKKRPNENIIINYLKNRERFQTKVRLSLNTNQDSIIYNYYDPSNFIKDSDNPLFRSGLIFAGANKTIKTENQDDGILTAYEISNLNLSGAKLVVLSACETGLGDIIASEGVFGLQRALKIAGAKNILMSLWKVPDIQTKELMSLFYENIFKGKSILTALQDAQTEMSKKYPPYYWAAFKLLE
jgi:CHAT domain-containing protein/tetratricopeptide (TPR) repeat protein